jgi:hypothetical protein
VTPFGAARLALVLCTAPPGSYDLLMEPPSRQASGKPEAYNRELIEKEIAHLKKNRSVRHAQEQSRGYSRVLMITAILAMVWIYIMDPVLFAYHRGDAIRAYLYLHNYGSDKKAAALAASGYFSSYERQELDNRLGSFQDYFVGTEAAEKQADALSGYIQGVKNLHDDNYPALTPLNKFRYVLFVKTGLTPPVRWEFLNPSIGIK